MQRLATCIITPLHKVVHALSITYDSFPSCNTLDSVQSGRCQSGSSEVATARDHQFWQQQVAMDWVWPIHFA